MTYEDIFTMTASLGIPSAYYEFPENPDEPVSPPFSVFYFPQTSDFMADSTNYAKIERMIWEIYTDTKDFSLEARAERILKEHGLTYSRSESFDNDQKLHQTTYSTSVLIKED